MKAGKGSGLRTDEQFARLELHMLRNSRGKVRVGDQRVISGIVHIASRAAAGLTLTRITGPTQDAP
jgi:hypothetical protein